MTTHDPALEFTTQAITAALVAAGFAEHDADTEVFGFAVSKAAMTGERIVEVLGVDLLPFNPGEGPRALLSDYANALEGRGYHVRLASGMVLIDPPEEAGQ